LPKKFSIFVFTFESTSPGRISLKFEGRSQNKVF
jgi:hypothetical protein